MAGLRRTLLVIEPARLVTSAVALVMVCSRCMMSESKIPPLASPCVPVVTEPENKVGTLSCSPKSAFELMLNVEVLDGPGIESEGVEIWKSNI